jgi:hypothetical protein
VARQIGRRIEGFAGSPWRAGEFGIQTGLSETDIKRGDEDLERPHTHRNSAPNWSCA